MSAGNRAPVAWRPSPEYVERANVTRLMRAHGIRSLDELHARSIADIPWFWRAVVDDLQIPFQSPFSQVLEISEGIAWPTWFVDGRINVAGACVVEQARRAPEALALIAESEDASVRRLTFRELERAVGSLANALLAAGIDRGDRVAIYLPMIPEAAIALYAIASIGAIATPIFSGLSAPAVAARLNEVDAKAVLTADGTIRRGSVHAIKPVLDQALRLCPGVRIVFVLDHVGLGNRIQSGRDLDWAEAVESEAALTPEPTSAEDPFMIVFTSGTSGQPKGAVHVHGGFLVKVAAEVAYQIDLHRGGVALWITDIGWIMGPWLLIGAHALGATMVMYEGAPDHPTPGRTWEITQRHSATTLGVSPTLVRQLAAAGATPVCDLPDLEILASGGEPWNPDPYRWLMRATGGRFPIINLSGGTEVGACFLSCHPVTAIKECSLGTPSLGMDVDVVDECGRSVRGSVGELVCRQPWPSMTRGLWGDPARYLDSYWSTYEGMWRHGDWALVDPDGDWFLLGRSDDVINVAGKRVGPAEIESVLVAHPAVSEAAAVGVPDDVKGEVAWCFCVAAERAPIGEGTVAELRARVVAELGKPFAPSRIMFVEALPKTRSAKIVRRALRESALGRQVEDVGAIENPDVLEAIQEVLSEGADA